MNASPICRSDPPPSAILASSGPRLGRAAYIARRLDIALHGYDQEKLNRLLARKSAIEGRLKSSARGHRSLLPVMICSKHRSQIHLFEEALKLGIAVITREGIESALNRSLVFQDADAFLDQLARSIDEEGPPSVT